MKKALQIITFFILILVVVPIFVNAEEPEAIVVTCEENQEFKVGTSRTCKAVIRGISGDETLLKAELGEGLTISLAAGEGYSIELVGEQTYLLTKGSSAADSVELDIVLSLAGDADIDKTGIELKLYEHFNEDYTIPSDEIGVSSGTVLFDVDCTPSETPEPPKEENVNVPDTASNLSTFVYVGGALFMAFGVYLIVQSRKKSE